MKKHTSNKWISILMAMVITFSNIPLTSISVFADETIQEEIVLINESHKEPKTETDLEITTNNSDDNPPLEGGPSQEYNSDDENNDSQDADVFPGDSEREIVESSASTNAGMLDSLSLEIVSQAVFNEEVCGTLWEKDPSGSRYIANGFSAMAKDYYVFYPAQREFVKLSAKPIDETSYMRVSVDDNVVYENMGAFSEYSIELTQDVSLVKIEVCKEANYHEYGFIAEDTYMVFIERVDTTPTAIRAFGLFSTEPLVVDGVYQINTADDLIWLRAYINDSDNGNPAADAILTADIDLGYEEWIPIGLSSAIGFAGTFDGNGKTISNMSITAGTYKGLFAYIGEGGEVKNLTIADSSVIGTEYLGLVAGDNAGQISDVIIKNSAVTSSGANVGMIGGIAGNNSGTITACANISAEVTGTQTSGTDRGVGGIAGNNTGEISYCYNNAHIIKNGSTTYGIAGGISGDNSGVINGCYNTGKVDRAYYTGGISGRNTKPISNCYNIGIVGDSAGGTRGEIYGTGTGGSALNCYYLNQAGASTANGIAKIEAELKSAEVLDLLNQGNAVYEFAPVGKLANSGYPYLTGSYIEMTDLIQLSEPTGLLWSNDTAIWLGDVDAIGYRVTLFKDSEQIIAVDVDTELYDFEAYINANGSGLYTFTIQAIGDGLIYYSSEISALSGIYNAAIEGQDVTLNISVPSGESFSFGDPLISVNVGAVDIIFKNQTAKFLPVGSYPYTIEAAGFDSISDTVEVGDSPITISHTMVKSIIWDGTTLVEPALDNGVYQIASGFELAWFRDEVNKGGANNTLNAALIANIRLGNFEWIPISSVSTNLYSGNFNGNGYTISEISVASGTYKGLFGYIGTAGEVKDLIIEDSSITGTNYLGFVAGSNAGTISGVTVKDSVLKGVVSIGGLAGTVTATGLISGCENISALIEQTVRNDSGVGGIAGLVDGGKIILSYNNANIVRANGLTDNYGYFGGIAGRKLGANSIIDSCYNTGNIPPGYFSGGIVGQNSAGVVSNSYSIGTVLKSGSYGGLYAGTTGTSLNSYYLDTCVGADGSGGGTRKTEIELQALAHGLGGAFDDDLSPNINKGYPILKWQNPDAEYGIKLTVIPEDAEVIVTEGSSNLIPVSSGGGVYVFSPLQTGTYDYTVSKDSEDYIPISGVLTIGYADAVEIVTLFKNTYTVDFAVAPVDAEISITTAGYEQTNTASNGVASFALPAGTYDYSAEKFGYATEIGSVIVSIGTGAATETVNLTENAKHEITFDITPTGSTLAVTHATQGVQTPISGTTYNLYEGEEYNYTIRLSGYVSVKAAFTVGNDDETLPIILTPGISSWDGVTKTEPELIGGVYQISDPEHLAWFRDEVNSQLVMGSGGNGSQITNASTSSTINAILLNDIDLGGYEWAPIGTFTVGSYSATGPYGFAGTFDGSGNTIEGLSITTGANGSGLFGTLMGATVKDLTVEGAIRGGQYTGAIAGYSTGGTTKYPSGTTISNCVSNVDITVAYTGTSSTYVGGITGMLTNSGYSNAIGLIEYCVNYGNIDGATANRQIYFGGIVGSLSYGIGVEFCGNEGNVTGVNYIGGIAGANNRTISGCYNTGNITASASANGAGGIVGESGTSGKTVDCYNWGSVTGTVRVGGIVGYMNDWSPSNVDNIYMMNCYNSGIVIATGTTGAIIGEKRGSSDGVINNVVFNTYYLNGTAVSGIGSMAHSNDEAFEKTIVEMQGSAFVTLLGDVAFQTVSGAYPILVWQEAGVDVLAQAKATKIMEINAVITGKNQALYTAESWAALLTAITDAIDGVNAAADISGVNAVVVPDSNAILVLVPLGDPVTIFISYQEDSDGFIIAKQAFEVEADLCERYGYEDDFNTQKVSALDAIVAAHIAIFGDDIDEINDVLEVSYGWLTNSMGSGSNFIYIVDGVFVLDPSGATEITDGQYVQLHTLQEASWGDIMAWFEYEGLKADAINVEVDQDFVLTLTSYADPMYDDYDIVNIGGASIVPVDVVVYSLEQGGSMGYFDSPIDTTAADGTITLNFDTIGTYVISAITTSGTPLMSPWLEITVGDIAPSVDKTALAAQIAQAQYKLDNAQLGTNQGEYPQSAADALAIAIAAAEAVINDTNATQLEVNIEISALSTAITIFGDAEIASEGTLVNYSDALESALLWIRGNTPNPIVNGIGGEWAVLALARAGISDQAWYDKYLAALDSAIASNNNELARWTDYERVTLALTSIGIDAASYKGKDLTAIFKTYTALSDRPVNSQTLNADIYALIALNSKPYTGNTQSYINSICAAEKSGGGWGLGTSATPDTTAMSVQALAPYYNTKANVKAAIDRALTWLYGQTVNDAEGNAQIIVALTALDINADDYVDELLKYYEASSGGFKRSGNVGAMTTEQAAYALVAYDRYKSNMNSLYNMADAGNWTAPLPVNKTVLADEIARAEALAETSYTAATWVNMQAALVAARTVYSNSSSTQAELDSAKNTLTAAINALVKISNSNTGVQSWSAAISVRDDFAKEGQTRIYYSNQNHEVEQGDTVYDLLVKTGLTLRTAGHIQYGLYVEAINGFGEFDDGPLSGWMYKVNGVFMEHSSSQHILSNGDRVEWVYTRDHGKDVGGSYFTGGYGFGNFNGHVDSVTSNGKATAIVDTEQVKGLLLQAIRAAYNSPNADAVPEVRLDVYTSTVATALDTKFKAEAIKVIAKESNAILTVSSDFGDITIDNATLKGLVNGVSDYADIVVSIMVVNVQELSSEQREIIGSDLVFELIIMADSERIHDFGGTVSVFLPYTLNGRDEKAFTVYYVNDENILIPMENVEYVTRYSIGGYLFDTTHFSLFIIAEISEVNELIEVYGALQPLAAVMMFSDVKEDDWFYTSVKYAFENGLMNGMGKNQDGKNYFAPYALLTRAMFVKILHNLEGGISVTADNPFIDVSNETWYSEAVIWAADSGIISGYGGGLFGPNDNITREQVAVVLRNYAKHKGVVIDTSKDLLAFTDAFEISTWALEAIRWTSAEGIIAGRTVTTLVPKGETTRAEIAPLLMRFIEGILE